MSTSRQVVRCLELLKVYSRLEKYPGFSYPLGVSADRITSNNLKYEDGNLSVIIPLSKDLILPSQDMVALSTYLAIIDEVTTWAMVVADEKSGRPGVSVSLQADIGPAWEKDHVQEIEIATRVNKIGKTIGFVQAEVRDAANGDLICSGSHIKYMNGLDAISRFFLSSYGWRMHMFYADYVASEPVTGTVTLSDLFAPLQLKLGTWSGKRIHFEGSPALSSGGGLLHGGAQCILMELSAVEAAKRELGNLDFFLQSMNVEFLSSPTFSVDLQAKVVPRSGSADFFVEVYLFGSSKLKSRGVLRFSSRDGRQPLSRM